MEPVAGIAPATVDHAKQRPHSIERASKVKASIGHGLERSMSRIGEGLTNGESRDLPIGLGRSTYGNARSSAGDDTSA